MLIYKTSDKELRFEDGYYNVYKDGLVVAYFNEKMGRDYPAEICEMVTSLHFPECLKQMVHHIRGREGIDEKI